MALSARDLQGAWNFRDVADSTGVLRPGRLFRSGELSDLGDGGRDELSRLGITVRLIVLLDGLKEKKIGELRLRNGTDGRLIRVSL